MSLQRWVRPMAKIPADDVYAQWAYSELNSLEQGALYVGADDLRAKAADNVPFTELSPQERVFLLRQWREVRAFDGSIFAAELASQCEDIPTGVLDQGSAWVGVHPPALLPMARPGTQVPRDDVERLD